MSHAIAIVSGGLDSVTMLYQALKKFDRVDVVSFDYGQRHKKEIKKCGAICQELGVAHLIVNLEEFAPFIAASGSSLITSTAVPDGHYAEQSMKQTVVPNRNMIMISMAASIAVARSANVVLTGVHSGDHFIYPDCRPEFIDALNAALVYGNQGFGAIPEHDKGLFLTLPYFLQAPFLWSSKEDIAVKAIELGVPIEKTWSCYKGGDVHCGKCGTCVERLEAIDGATNRWLNATGQLYKDLTEYEDTEFWRTAKADD